MREKRRKDIIESAIKLFAEKGFYATSVQHIVSDCGMSKGAFYNYFTSKEELHIAIFQYYFEKIRYRMSEIEENESLSPRERMMEQMIVPLEQFSQQKEFVMMYMREQSFTINDELREIMQQTLMETALWYKTSLIEIYGDKIKPYIGDIILTIEGIRHGFFTAILINNIPIDTNQLPTFIFNRIDELVAAFENGEEPLLKKTDVHYFPQLHFDTIEPKEKAKALLQDMNDQLDVLDIEDEKKTGLQSVIDFLIKDIEKQEIEKYVFQGMLANLKEIDEFDDYRKKIAALLQLKLL